MVVLEGTSDELLSTFLGLDRANDFVQTEKEYPELVAAVWPAQTIQSQELPLALDPQAVQPLSQGNWHGKANRLSRDNPIPWEIIDDVAEASWKSSQIPSSVNLAPSPLPSTSKGEGKSNSDQLTAGQIIHQRRSAVSFDGQTSISAQRFFTMLTRVMPRGGQPASQRPMPWDSIPWNPAIHLALFVHRVEGIPSGTLHVDPRALKKNLKNSNLPCMNNLHGQNLNTAQKNSLCIY